MSKDNILEWSTAASNTDVGGVNIAENCPPSGINNAIREAMEQLAAGITRHVTKTTGTYTALKADHNQFWRATGAVEVDLTAAATLTSGWCIWLKANGGAITIDPDGSEEINGSATSLVIADGNSAFVLCTGTAFQAITFVGADTVGISNVVEDTTPQLGGALDAQGHDINNGGVIFLTEQAAAEADVAGKGQFWVETATPNLPKFTDDAGTDFTLATATSVAAALAAHAGVAKAWAYVTVSAGTPTLQAGSLNITSITDTGTGELTITIATDFASANWSSLVTIEDGDPAYGHTESKAAGSVLVTARDDGGLVADPSAYNFAGFGAQ